MNHFRLFFFACLLSSASFISCTDDGGTDNLTIENGTFELILQPNADEGKDAVIWTERPDRPSPNHKDFQAMGWTWYAHNFDGGIRRSLIEFDLSTIPPGAKIEDATLSLFYNPKSAEIPSTFGHSQRDGSNRSILSRITSPWSEDLVTWNNQPSISTDNQIFVKASDAADEDYQIDVKNLIEDMIDNPSSSFGFLYQLDNENYYRAMIFASSDHENEDLHPKLEVTYTVR